MDRCADFSRIAETITAALQKPVALGEDVLDFMASGLGAVTGQQLRQVFTAAGSSESAAVLDLVFSPSISLQLELEIFLSGCGLEKKQVDRLLRQLAAGKMQSIVLLPDGQIPLPVFLSPEIIEAFVRRLNLDWSCDPVVSKALEAYCPGKAGRGLQVLMRNRRCRFHAASAAFTAELAGLMCGHENFPEIFEMLVLSLDQWPRGLDAFGFLAAQRNGCTETLAKAARIDAFRRQSGFEYALSSGVRVPYVDEHAVRRKLALLDEICLAVFGSLPAGP